MVSLKRIIKCILRKVCIVSNKDTGEKQNNVSLLYDEKLISMIGMEMHCFCYPE